jgi:spoIIIJ-associated protein
MVEQERKIETSGVNIDEAINKGLEELGLERSEVDVVVLDGGSSGFLGIGGRDATVRLTEVKEEGSSPDSLEDATSATFEQEEIADASSSAADASSAGPVEVEEFDGPPEQDVAKEIVDNLLEKLQFEASTSLHQTEPDDLTGERRWVVDVSGQDLGMLIGTRGETLNALQHVTRLMTGHAIHRRPTFILDVQGYRSRREQALARLADRMATKVMDRGRPMTLEPMPPNERRIIHITLRDDDRVYTESFGDGRQRKVRIYPSDQE